MSDREEKAISKLLRKCVKEEETEIIVKLILKLQKDYIELAFLSTDGQYKEHWTHKKVLDYLTKGAP
jgi:hypothetical protein